MKILKRVCPEELVGVFLQRRAIVHDGIAYCVRSMEWTGRREMFLILVEFRAPSETRGVIVVFRERDNILVDSPEPPNVILERTASDEDDFI
jgi:hypothetical protein